jgi:hypothetical protein
MRIIRWVAGAFVVVLLVSAVYVLSASQSRASPEQPLQFSHKSMVPKGIPCLFCHAGATRSPAAGIPSLQSCMGCHPVIAADKPGVQALTGYWERQQPVAWVRVNRLPRFVYFSHQVHVAAAGLNCERCHGDVGQMTVVRPVAKMNMGWCLRCHTQQSNAAQLRDCIVCHL